MLYVFDDLEAKTQAIDYLQKAKAALIDVNKDDMYAQQIDYLIACMNDDIINDQSAVQAWEEDYEMKQFRMAECDPLPF